MSENKQYEKEYKVQAVKLAKKLGAVKAVYGKIEMQKKGSKSA